MSIRNVIHPSDEVSQVTKLGNAAASYTRSRVIDGHADNGGNHQITVKSRHYMRVGEATTVANHHASVDGARTVASVESDFAFTLNVAYQAAATDGGTAAFTSNHFVYATQEAAASAAATGDLINIFGGRAATRYPVKYAPASNLSLNAKTVRMLYHWAITRIVAGTSYLTNAPTNGNTITMDGIGILTLESSAPLAVSTDLNPASRLRLLGHLLFLRLVETPVLSAFCPNLDAFGWGLHGFAPSSSGDTRTFGISSQATNSYKFGNFVMRRNAAGAAGLAFITPTAGYGSMEITDGIIDGVTATPDADLVGAHMRRISAVNGTPTTNLSDVSTAAVTYESAPAYNYHVTSSLAEGAREYNLRPNTYVNVVSHTVGADHSVESTGHGLSVNDSITFKDVTGTAASVLNKTHIVKSVTDVDNFTIEQDTTALTATGGAYVENSRTIGRGPDFAWLDPDAQWEIIVGEPAKTAWTATGDARWNEDTYCYEVLHDAAGVGTLTRAAAAQALSAGTEVRTTPRPGMVERVSDANGANRVLDEDTADQTRDFQFGAGNGVDPATAKTTVGAAFVAAVRTHVKDVYTLRNSG